MKLILMDRLERKCTMDKLSSLATQARACQRTRCRLRALLLSLVMVSPLVLLVYNIVFSAEPTMAPLVKLHPLHFLPAKYLNIMEEHHEALMYWYSAAATGAIKERDNVLLHIDGHSDAARPKTWRKMPLFKWPRNMADLKLMMEKNDVFVQVSAATGLINRFIWVWPPYDSGGYGHDNNEPYVSVMLKMGTTFREGTRDDDDDDDKYVLERCFCAESSELDIENKCSWIDRDREDDEKYIDLDASKCLDRFLTGTVEFVSTDKAIELARTGNWITESDSVILDIDEDYYACESASSPLYDVGMKEATIDSISFYISKLMCVDNAKDEQLADNLFHNIIQIVIRNVRRCRENRNKEYCLLTLRLTNMVLEESLTYLAKTWKVMCLPNQSTLFILKKLVRHLVKLSVAQLSALENIGVCMDQSPRSTSFNINDGMVLCKGYNGPNTTLIPYHSVDEYEIVNTTKILETILSQPFVPGVITLIRSVRDGYTPRHRFHSIEPKVLNVLKTTYPMNVNENTINYDSELLGGPNGWYNRHNR